MFAGTYQKCCLYQAVHSGVLLALAIAGAAISATARTAAAIKKGLRDGCACALRMCAKVVQVLCRQNVLAPRRAASGKKSKVKTLKRRKIELMIMWINVTDEEQFWLMASEISLCRSKTRSPIVIKGRLHHVRRVDSCNYTNTFAKEK
ncbi:hypothetical protein NPIL_170611 [Nephila pilipes]|uniref:Uncharacterized protein n=1 Tax=Nephila pilipes TaxID=299642 RepID=A0A8X6PF56_NEPPI|nr:hypothetical protein NPIL_170611 [Nephila pilipes]